MIGAHGTTTDRVHRALRGEHRLPVRMLGAARALRGRPYHAFSLIGGPHERERLVADLQGLDCVTFVESVLALALSSSRSGFVRQLKLWRYREGRVEWRMRLHYFSDWMAVHARRGALRPRTRGSGAHTVTETLGIIPELPRRTRRIALVPKRTLRSALDRIGDGSVIAFGSVRARLDFFHTGLVFVRRTPVRSADDLLLWHASRSRKKVIAEPLAGFLERNRMRGIAFATPIPPSSGRFS